ncbi:sigma-70 family RNA polymerase sigma factor [Actinomadura madurae]|uniref:sigma-70 family RNA polymerase sigma factor n=1 Tax=Actinomadura madurae TaxID=1993 RepID=UPI003FD8155E
MLLIYNRPGFVEELGEAERDALFAEVGAIMKELEESGEWVGGEALADPSTTKTVRERGGQPGRDGRAVPGGQGALRRLPHRRLRDRGAGRGDRQAVAGRPVRRAHGGPGGHEPVRDGDVSTPPAMDGGVAEELLRTLAPQVLGTLVRRHGAFDACEDAVQEALLAAAVQWPGEGVPENPRGWLLTVATRRLTDQWRSERARRDREAAVSADGRDEPGPDAERPGDRDDTLTLLFLCCHPSLSPSSQVALTLRAVGGLTTAQIARAFLVPEATMAQRVSRAKQKIKAAGARFAMPPPAERDERLRAVLHVLYLIFNEGYTASSGPDLQRTDLTAEAIRLARALRGLLPGDGETAGLLALMLLTDARRAARTGRDGMLIPSPSRTGRSGAGTRSTRAPR